MRFQEQGRPCAAEGGEDDWRRSESWTCEVWIDGEDPGKARSTRKDGRRRRQEGKEGLKRALFPSLSHSTYELVVNTPHRIAIFASRSQSASHFFGKLRPDLVSEQVGRVVIEIFAFEKGETASPWCAPRMLGRRDEMEVDVRDDLCVPLLRRRVRKC